MWATTIDVQPSKVPGSSRSASIWVSYSQFFRTLWRKLRSFSFFLSLLLILYEFHRNVLIGIPCSCGHWVGRIQRLVRACFSPKRAGRTGRTCMEYCRRTRVQHWLYRVMLRMRCHSIPALCFMLFDTVRLLLCSLPGFCSSNMDYCTFVVQTLGGIVVWSSGYFRAPFFRAPQSAK